MTSTEVAAVLADIEALIEQWDGIAKGETSTTRRLRAVVAKHRVAADARAVDAEELAWVLNAVDWPDQMGDDDYSREQARAVLAHYEVRTRLA